MVFRVIVKDVSVSAAPHIASVGTTYIPGEASLLFPPAPE